MTTELLDLSRRLLAAFDTPGLELPIAAVRLFHLGEAIPEGLRRFHPDAVSVTSCQAARQAELGEPVLLSRANIGCVAAGISLGLVAADEPEPLATPRLYTELMREQSGCAEGFCPPAPSLFTDGTVYACAEAERPDLCLFGPNDSGRFKDRATAARAVAAMPAIQPATTAAVFLYPPAFAAPPLLPDVVVLSLRPVELTRLVQGWQFITGERIEASMGGLRAVNADLIVHPYQTGRINVSPYCLGARLIARYQPDRLGVGIPFASLRTLVEGLEASRTGYPFAAYPGAAAEHN